jgi:hypothetical protein
MHSPQDRPVWRLDGELVDTMQVACRLASLEPIEELHCRGLPLEAVAIDVTSCHRTAADVFHRVYRIRPLSRTMPGTPRSDGLPEEWTCGAISMPRGPRKRVESKLSEFETEFALYTFLQRVGREIESCLQRLPDAAKRGACEPSADGGSAA